jgi:hypothetical protein
MRPGYGKSFRRRILPATWPGCSSVCAPRSRREKCLGGGDPETDYSAAGRTGAPSDWFRNGVLDTATGTFSPHHKSHWLRTLCDVDFTPPVEGKRWKPTRRISGAGSTVRRWQTGKRDVILAALFMVLANRYDWQLFLEVTGRVAAGKVFWPKLRRCLPGKITPRRRPSKRWNHRANVPLIGFSLIRLPDQENGAVTGQDSRPSPAGCGLR